MRGWNPGPAVDRASDPRRGFRPEVERLDPLVSPSAILPSEGLVDVRSTPIVDDLRDDLLRSTPHDGRQGWSLNLIEADPATRTVYGSVTPLYRAKPLGGVLTTSYSSRVKLKVDIAFATGLDAPKPRDVKVSVSRNIPGFGQNVRNTMALGVIAFLKQDHDAIAADLRGHLPAGAATP